MSLHDSEGAIIRYIRQSIYDGKEPEENGYYVFPVQEFSRVINLTLRTLRKHMPEIVRVLSTTYDFESWAKFKGLKGENIYVDVSFDKDILKLRRNPLTEKPEYEFLWGLPLLDPWWFVDWMDEKHRRRCSDDHMVYDAVPFRWDADQFEGQIQKARQEIKAHRELHLYVPWSKDK